ncbi:uncharacterized protein [Epargyreus clarus]|uniref:uncharacterized protein n=1 Tax=Epargyreus clarus TaxID=520877 RepID=UPI003C2BC804
MEVGAVKQAFNNEVILLKKKLNQAKIQIIHKLTRKAKTLTEKKVPETLKGKFNKKAESAVKEVLIIKKIKPRDVAKFIVTHKGQLNEYLNRPTVDIDKACARLLLHKALQDKYKFIRERFSNISIEDLLMSRQERRKLKKEAREKQKDKKKGKGNEPVQVEGDWDVEDINMDESEDKNNASDDDDEIDDKSDESDDDNIDKEQSGDESDAINESDDDLKSNNTHLIDRRKEKIADSNENSESDDDEQSDDEPSEDDDDRNSSLGQFVKSTPSITNNDKIVNNNSINKVEKKDTTIKKNVEKKHKDSHKNRNLNTKILMKTFHKDTSELPTQETKVVDPFFITATGENYMSVAEPRQPDEVKEVHKEGNRKYRRAVMFGHVPKAKPRRDDFRPDRNNPRFNKFDDNRNNFNSKTDKFTKFDDNKNNFNAKRDNRTNGFDNNQRRFNNSDDSKNIGNFNKSNVSKRNIDETKPEKLHPSWEAKKRQSGILPFQGKKIVFDEG